MMSLGDSIIVYNSDVKKTVWENTDINLIKF